MRIVGVVDLREGRAVHARAGQRDRYLPVQAAAGHAIGAGDAIALARAYVDELGIGELYAADLDALSGGRLQDTLIAAIASIGAPLLIDAAVTSVDQAREILAFGADRVVVALETLPDFAALDGICTALGGERVAFSLDLRDGDPVNASGRAIAREAPDVIAARAQDAGAGTVIVIDLARVGTGRGLDLHLLATVRDAARRVTLLAGGGVRSADDLLRLAAVGCDGALVASALHDGRLGAAEVAAAHRHASVSR